MSTEIKIGLIGGSGLDNPDILKNRTEKIVSTPYGSPSDALILGDIDSIPVVFLARHGRKHDIIPGNINYRANIWALKEEGCTHILDTNACGSYIEEIAPGDLVVIDSFIDRTTNRQQTFYDVEIGHLKGICHMSMEPAFCQKTRMVILETAKDLGIKVKDGGTILVTDGPRYESRVESNLFKSWGAYLVGMTSVPEVVLAKEAGICYAAICMVTAYGCWRKSEQVSHQRILEIVQQNIEKVLQLLLAVVSRIGQANWEETIQEAKVVVEDSSFTY